VCVITNGGFLFWLIKAALHIALQMKKLLLLISISVPFISIAQKKVADTSRKKCVTPVGIPFGNISSEKIDNKGGAIKSADGRLELYFPAGALKNETTISIQSCSNTMLSGVGTAYKLEPSGTVFDQPVKAVLHYNESELKGNSPALLSLALQNDKGLWGPAGKIIRDTLAKTLTGSIRHFSYMAQYFSIFLDPPSAVLKVNEKMDFTIYHVIEQDDNDPDAEAWYAYYKEDLFYTIKEPPVWKANGVVNGDAISGTISDPHVGSISSYAKYQAPATIPDANPVAVAAEMFFTPDNSGTDNKGGQWSSQLVLVSNVTIVENAYRFTYIHKNFAGCFHYIDSSTCVINLDKKIPELVEINNYNPWSDWDRCGKCNLQYTNKETFKANVEIWGMQNSKIIPATNEKPITEIYIGL